MSDRRVIFDLDDTLYPERDFAIGGFKAASRLMQERFGTGDVTAEMTALLDAGHLGALFAMVLARAKPGYSEPDLKAVLAAYASHTPKLALFDDAAAALADFAARGGPLGLITDGHAKAQAAKVAALGLTGTFHEVVYTGALGPGRAYHKPHAKAFEIMQAAIGGDPRQFVYVGDNPAKDFLAPNGLGWLTVMIDRPAERSRRIHKPMHCPPGGAPQHTIASLADLAPYLGKYLGTPAHRAPPT